MTTNDPREWEKSRNPPPYNKCPRCGARLLTDKRSHHWLRCPECGWEGW